MQAIALTRQRARTDAQKESRRCTILAAAETHLRSAGYEQFSMTETGKLAGVSKGTLYLYFETREVLLLALFNSQLGNWVTRLAAATGAECKDGEFAEQFYSTSRQDELLLVLYSRLNSVIEHNIPSSQLVESKRIMIRELKQLSESLAPRLKLTPLQVMDVLRSMAPLMMGACQADLGPQFEDQSLPEDVTDFIGQFESRAVFVTNARRILAGIRAGIE